MTVLDPQGLSSGSGEHLILYDGVCGLCNRLNQFVPRRDASDVFDFASLQSVTARSVLQQFGLNVEPLTAVHVVQNYRSTSPVLKSRAVAVSFVLKTLSIRGPLSWLFRVLPEALLNLGYDLIARNRYRLFGKSASCKLPNAEISKRFIDV